MREMTIGKCRLQMINKLSIFFRRRIISGHHVPINYSIRCKFTVFHSPFFTLHSLERKYKCLLIQFFSAHTQPTVLNSIAVYRLQYKNRLLSDTHFWCCFCCCSATPRLPLWFKVMASQIPDIQLIWHFHKRLAQLNQNLIPYHFPSENKIN